jgi:hypothetical protein
MNARSATVAEKEFLIPFSVSRNDILFVQSSRAGWRKEVLDGKRMGDIKTGAPAVGTFYVTNGGEHLVCCGFETGREFLARDVCIAEAGGRGSHRIVGGAKQPESNF